MIKIRTKRLPDIWTELGLPVLADFGTVFVHPTVNWYGDRHPDKSYTITHKVSGWALTGPIPDVWMAFRYAKVLDTLPEMAYHAKIVRRSPRVRRIIHAMKGEAIRRRRIRFRGSGARSCSPIPSSR